MPYHDEEWGVPVHDDRLWFEFVTLEGAQAGLSWETILRKRDSYRIAFDNFEPAVVAAYNDAKVQALLADPGIIRNRLKVASAITNAKAFLEVQRELGSFDAFIWGFVGGSPQVNARQSMDEVPATTPESDALSKETAPPRLQICGQHHLLRPDASHRPGERPHHQLLPPRSGGLTATHIENRTTDPSPSPAPFTLRYVL